MVLALLQVRSDLVGLAGPDSRIDQRATTLRVQIITGPTREDVLVIMPDVLVARRLIVLAQRDTIGLPGSLDRCGHTAREQHHGRGDVIRECVEILMMIMRDHQDMSGIGLIAHRGDQRAGESITHDDVRRQPQGLWSQRLPGQQIAERAVVVVGCMRTSRDHAS